MSDRSKRARAALMQLATELITENEDLERRFNAALALLDEQECADCMGEKTDPITKMPCVWCARIDALRVTP